MIRTMMWLCLYLLFLGFASFDVRYRDGLHIQLYGWADRKKRRLK